MHEAIHIQNARISRIVSRVSTIDSMLALLVADDPRRSADRILNRLVQVHRARGGAVLRPLQDQAELWISASPRWRG